MEEIEVVEHLVLQALHKFIGSCSVQCHFPALTLHEPSIFLRWLIKSLIEQNWKKIVRIVAALHKVSFHLD